MRTPGVFNVPLAAGTRSTKKGTIAPRCLGAHAYLNARSRYMCAQ
jgi:hypothetical protein